DRRARRGWSPRLRARRGRSVHLQGHAERPDAKALHIRRVRPDDGGRGIGSEGVRPGRTRSGGGSATGNGRSRQERAMKTVPPFAITTALATPATLVADIQADGPELRPERATVHIGDATVSIDLDRGVMLDGNTVSGVLIATSSRPHDVTVDVVALEDMGVG